MNYDKLSKEVSYALRHAPWEYELEMDEEGWVLLKQLLDALNSCSEWKDITQDDVIDMIESSEKRRHEILNGRIRAYYGHSVPNKILKKEMNPPEILYHGTSKRFLAAIKEKGLLPQGRNYVHLSQDIETAIQVGKRRGEHPVILTIQAQQAYTDDIKFYLGNEKVWLADSVPTQYIGIKEV